ncbi:MAG TPA: triphosphoribosyl-dephospho-CoA synthase CitG, partial [Clostridia bacterium]|nr:triphosphoribosyl-dephospho-CoA synthase CitG [Clostridia bacterium]
MKSIIDIYGKIGECCISALLSEVSASPKPGLVDRQGNGAHKDMDFITFTDSILAISPYFSRFAEAGSSLGCIDDRALSRLRPLGIECEEAMFKATGGVNTHKGAIFSLGLLSAAAGYCHHVLHDLSAETVCNTAGAIAAASERDFLLPEAAAAITKGLELYKAYGIRGIRGEAASGFYSVRRYALPVMRELLTEGVYSKNDIYLQVLLHLMSHVEDTNVISRCGIGAMEYVKGSAADVLSMGGALTPQGKEGLLHMDEEYIKRNISPGGCADLLSVAITLQLLE